MDFDIINTIFFYFLALKVCWKRKLVSICEDPVSGLMSVMSDYDRLLCDSPVLPYLHRLSVCGLFIRRILLGFEKLSFTEVSNFAAIFKQYCCDGLTILLEYQPEINSQSELSALVEFTQEMNKSIGKILTENRITNARFNKSESKWSQKQSDFYVSKQVALLQSSESNADSPKTVEDTGKSFSEELILASTNPQYDKRLFMELPVHVLPMFCTCIFHGNSINNLLSYCGLIDAKIRASDKDLTVSVEFVYILI